MHQITTIKSVQATASGDTDVWTPVTGNKLRLSRFRVQVTANATLAARGVLTIKLKDGSTDLNLTHDVYLGQTAVSADTNPQQLPLFDSGWVELDGGWLSSTVDNKLKVNLSAALASGNVRVIAAGRED